MIVIRHSKSQKTCCSIRKFWLPLGYRWYPRTFDSITKVTKISPNQHTQEILQEIVRDLEVPTPKSTRFELFNIINRSRSLLISKVTARVKIKLDIAKIFVGATALYCILRFPFRIQIIGYNVSMLISLLIFRMSRFVY